MRSHDLFSIRARRKYAGVSAVVYLALGLAGAQSAMPVGPQADAGSSMSGGDMSHMAGHMFLTSLRPMQPGDQQKADAVVAAAKRRWSRTATTTRLWPTAIKSSCPMFRKPSITFPGATMRLRLGGNSIHLYPPHCCIQKLTTEDTSLLV